MSVTARTYIYMIYTELYLLLLYCKRVGSARFIAGLRSVVSRDRREARVFGAIHR